MKRNNQGLLWTIILILALAVIVETAYLVSMKGGIGQPFERPRQSAQQKTGMFGAGAVLAEEWDPFAEMERLQDDINRLFRDRIRRALLRVRPDRDEESFPFIPDSDISETDNHYIVTMDIPGMEKGNIDVELEGNYLTIAGTREREGAVDKKNMYKRERVFGSFTKTIALPGSVGEEGISADYEKGVLTVRIPKAQGEKVDHLVQVSVT